ncbi:MbtH family protein [Kitasatospora sp. NPDC127121]|uniref:MbtH family protein n=1 Tax=Kitasatospora sp. NPDC127121 TaxID=3345371 RepID=UPI0036428389
MTEDQYHVVVNHEEQYSIWPTYHDVPQGWRTVGEPASREDCLRRIEEEWDDMTPKSARRQAGPAAPVPAGPAGSPGSP